MHIQHRGINMKRSDSYIMTADVKCAGDMLEIETIRKTISSINKINKRNEQIEEYRYNTGWSDLPARKYPRYRVKLQGRGPRTKPSILDGRGFRGYDQSLPLRHAERLDVYVHER